MTDAAEVAGRRSSGAEDEAEALAAAKRDLEGRLADTELNLAEMGQELAQARAARAGLEGRLAELEAREASASTRESEQARALMEHLEKAQWHDDAAAVMREKAESINKQAIATLQLLSDDDVEDELKLFREALAATDDSHLAEFLCVAGACRPAAARRCRAPPSSSHDHARAGTLKPSWRSSWKRCLC